MTQSFNAMRRFRRGEVLSASAHYLFLTTRYQHPYASVTSNGGAAGSTRPVPSAATPNAASLYNRTFAPNAWLWAVSAAMGNVTSGDAYRRVASYNDTSVTVFLAGAANSVAVATSACPLAGCAAPPPQLAIVAEPFLRWSSSLSWSWRPGGKPAANESVTLPANVSLLLDESPPPLGLLTLQGALRFDPAQDVTLTAEAIVVTGQVGEGG
jgi:hypothetical protein